MTLTDMCAQALEYFNTHPLPDIVFMDRCVLLLCCLLSLCKVCACVCVCGAGGWGVRGMSAFLCTYVEF